MNRSPLMMIAATGCIAAGLLTSPSHAGDCQSSKRVAKASTCNSAQADIVATAVNAGSFKTLAAALTAADLVHALQGDGPFTVFAPTDEAFAKLPKGTVETLLKPENKAMLTAILTYHVAPGELRAADVVTRTSVVSLNGQRAEISTNDGVRIDNATVTATDILCSNGVIHVIDRVILPSSDSILETAAKAGSFGTLAAAIKTAGLVHTLSDDGPFTVFAPTDAAFEKLPAGTVESLLEPENRHQLVEILKYHVVPGRIYASDALQAQSTETVQGSRVRFRLNGNGLMINDATVLQPDIEATNGVIHVIDQVILPS
jgi:uncharacterized surface protein with fasciclin (FAS1) repeats